MSTIMMSERAMATGANMTTVNSSAIPAAANMCMLPRCTMKFEKCAGGFKINCSCDDEVACGALQNLCKMLAGGACSCCCLWNGMTMCMCNLCCGHCKCEMTKNGCCITCTSGDKECCKMLQACCDCLSACYDAGCQCCVSLGNTPVCCGCNC